MTASSPKLNDLLAAATRLQAKFENDLVHKAGAGWQEKWRIEQKARTAALIVTAIKEILTSEGNT